MLLTITTTHRPATDLGFLLRKHPGRAQTFDVSAGRAHVFYPEANEERCTVALLLELDAVGLARSSRRRNLRQYVNDRPYTGSSFLSTALLKVFGSAMTGAGGDRPELAATPIPLVARLSMVACPGDGRLLERLFGPLGYAVRTTSHPVDDRFPEWGASTLHGVELEGTVRLSALLEHLYVLVPVLDPDKHYWIDRSEVDKLLRRGEGWLAAHPERAFIVRRYLRGLRRYTTDALEQLVETDEDDAEGAEEEPLRLSDARRAAVLAALKARGCARVLDIGCGEGGLLRMLLDDPSFVEVVGMDVSHRALELARERLHLERMPEARRARLTLLHGSLTYRDARLAGFDGAAAVEVIEHVDRSRLHAFEQTVLTCARPGTLVVTTPNAEYNRRFGMAAGARRHPDHRFEWTRAEFRAWASGVAERQGYDVRVDPVGPLDPDAGAPTQMATFIR